MTNILFFTFYEPCDYILDIKEGFENCGTVIYDLPYFQLKNEKKMSDLDIANKCATIVIEQRIEIVFMFLLPEVNGYIHIIKKEINKMLYSDVKKPIFVFYNFDDPKSINTNIVKYSKGIDYIFTPCVSSVSRLKCLLKKETNVIYVPMYFKNISGLNNQMTHTKFNNIHDICILYSKDAEHVYDMKNIIRDIKMLCIDNSLNIKILGDIRLEEEYPDIYKGIYTDANVISKVLDSKIVFYIRDNVLSNTCYDTILPILLAHGTLVMTAFSSNTEHILKNGHNCMIFEKSTFLEKILSCLLNYQSYESIKNNAKNSILTHMSIDRWCYKILYTVGYEI